jgi:cytochrome c-type biogenesis protein CcmF
LGAWLIVASLWDIVRAGNIRALPSSRWASVLAHVGLGITLLGVTGTTVWRSQGLDVLAPGQSMNVGGYTLTLNHVEHVKGPNYTADRAVIDVSSGGKHIATMGPEKRMFPAQGMATSDTAIRTTGFEDLYLALGDQRENGRWTIRAYTNPLAPFIWFGGAFMALGGLASLWGRLRRRARLPDAKAVPVQ